MVVGDRRADLRAALRLPLGLRSGHHQRRSRSDRGRPDRRGGGRVRRACRWSSIRRWRSGSGRSSRALRGRWRDVGDESHARGRAQAGAGAGGRGGARAGRHGARAGRAGRRAGRASWCCPGRRASCSRCGRRALDVRAGARRCSRARVSSSSGSCGSRACPSPQLAATLRELDADPTRWRSRPACGAASSRSRRCSSRRRPRTTRRSRRRCSSRFGACVFSRDGATIDDSRRGAAARASVRTVAIARVLHGRADGGRG